MIQTSIARPAVAPDGGGTRRRFSVRGNSSAWIRRFGLWAVLLLVVLALMIASPTFRQVVNLENVLDQSAIIGIVSCGMAIMMIAGGFDLSVGAVGATSAVAGAAVSQHLGTVPAIIAALVVGFAVGMANGLLVARAKVNAFIATFAMSSVILGLLYVSTAAESVSVNSSFLVQVASERWGGIPVNFLIFVVCIVLVWFILTRTKFGHYVYSVGGNAEASHLSGVPVRLVQTFAFVVGGLFASLGGLLLLGQTTIGQPSAAADWPLRAIAICVVAGIALTGGIGRAPDVLAATLLLGVIGNGLNQLGVSPYWQPTVTGIVILVAVSLDQYNRLRGLSSSSGGSPSTVAPAVRGADLPTGEGTDLPSDEGGA
jgi:ribose transport system permease protein